MTKPLSAFYPWVMALVPGAPDILIDQVIRQSAIAFCDETDIVQQVFTANIVAGTQDYTITPPAEMKLARVLSGAWYNKPLSPVSPNDVVVPLALRGVTIGEAVPLSGAPAYYFQKTPNDTAISLYPIPDTALTAGLTIKASFTPTNTAATVDDILFDDWVEEIGAGAVFRLMIMPGQPFSNTSMAPMYGQAFNLGVNAAKRLKNAGQLHSPLRVQPRGFA